MSTIIPLSLIAMLLLGLLPCAGLLLLTCKLFGVRYPAEGNQLGPDVRFGRCVLLAFVGLLVVTGLVGICAATVTRSNYAFALLGHFALLILLLTLLFRLGLPVGWAKALGVEVVWSAFCLPLTLIGLALLLAVGGSFYIIPTGAMAESILGYHKEIDCPQCGYRFAVNASAEAAPFDGPPSVVSDCICPNCRHSISLAAGPMAAPAGSIPDPGIRSGDRILAGHGLFGAKHLPVERFDPVVFDWPGDRDGSVPMVPIQYVMRVVGLPTEEIAIRRGELFARERELPPRFEDDGGFDIFVPGRREAFPDNDWTFRPHECRLLRKPPALVLAMRHLVSDSRFTASDLTRPEERRWIAEPNSGWMRSGFGFSHDGSDKETAWVRYRHILRGSDKPQLITDFSGYNQWNARGGGHEPPTENWVNDLILECDLDAGSTGEVSLELSRGQDRFVAHFDLGSRKCTLVRRTKDKAETLKEASVKVPARNARLRFANVDERLTVWVDEKLVFGDGVGYVSPAELIPEKENDLDRPASVGVKGAAVVVKRLRLYRDTYFTTARGGRPNIADVPTFDPADPATWPQLSHSPAATYTVKPNHYFVLGDNSQESSDSRSWGQVPEKNLLGKVLWRYYPFSRFGIVE